MSFEQERERLVRDIAVVCFESVLSLSFERASDVLIFVLSFYQQGIASATQLMTQLNANLEALDAAGEPIDAHSALWLNFYDSQSVAEPLADDLTDNGGASQRR